MGKVNTQLNFLCGKCKNFFATEQAVKAHAKASHSGLRVVVYRQCTVVDMREEAEQSYADRQIAAMQAVAMGEHTDDEWLIP
jgi:alkanesulfonate monooxygenase SsuD/methylene tetrahydromethanopterin reductase-like flavin-dependent oxidoreductase (luciferase family)